MRYILLLMIFWSCLSASPVDISQGDDISLLERSTVFIQKQASYDANATKPKDEEFKPSGADFISRGYTTDEAVWVRFSLCNTSDEPIERVIHLNNSMLDTITLYEQNGTATTLGALSRPPFDGIIDFYFPIELKPNETRTFHLKALSNS